MAILGTLLLTVGGLVTLIGAIWLLITAFQESIVWGLCSFFIPFAILAFIGLHWNKASKPFFVWLSGFIPYLIGLGLTYGSA